MIVRRRCKVLGIIQFGAFGPATSTRIALQILLNIPVLGRGVINCNVSPRIKDLRSQLCFLSLPPSITVVSEKDNSFNNNNKNFKYDPTVWETARIDTLWLWALFLILKHTSGDIIAPNVYESFLYCLMRIIDSQWRNIEKYLVHCSF